MLAQVAQLATLFIAAQLGLLGVLLPAALLLHRLMNVQQHHVDLALLGHQMHIRVVPLAQIQLAQAGAAQPRLAHAQLAKLALQIRVGGLIERESGQLAGSPQQAPVTVEAEGGSGERSDLLAPQVALHRIGQGAHGSRSASAVKASSTLSPLSALVSNSGIVRRSSAS